VGSGETGAAGSADRGAAAAVFVVGGDVADAADALVRAHRVVEDPEPVELSFQLSRVFDLLKVWVLGLDARPRS
jgi:hypothetical protein